MSAPVSDVATLPDGITLPYLEQGNSGAAPVVMLHGLPGTMRSFEPVLPHLPPTVRAFVPTQRGHGDASRPEEGYGFGAFAADLAAFLDAIELETAVIAGHSLGSMVAQRFAIDHRDRARGIVLVGSGLPGQVDLADLDPDTEELWAAIQRLTDPVSPAFARAYLEGFIPEDVTPAPYRAHLDLIEPDRAIPPARAWQEVWTGLLEDEWSEELSQIDVPALVVWGERDPFCLRSEQDRLVAALSGCRLDTYSGAAHSPHWEQPERFASDLTAFSIDARPS